MVDVDLKCCFVDYGPNCELPLINVTAINPRTVSIIQENTNRSFTNACSFHKSHFNNNFLCCVNPFNSHKKTLLYRKCVISFEMRDAYKLKYGEQSFVVGDPLCRLCFLKFNSSSMMSHNVKDRATAINNKLTQVCKLMHVSPVKVDFKDKIKVREMKLDKQIGTVSTSLSQDFGVVSPTNFPPFALSAHKNFLIKLQLQVESAKTFKDKVHFLTLAPENWQIKEIMRFFKVSQYMATVARKLDIFDFPVPKVARSLSESDKRLVIEIYDRESDCRPGMFECVSVVENGQRCKKQIKLLNCTIDELFALYKAESKAAGLDPVGRSTFFQLRPKEVVSADKPGMHSVCVCVYHQNVELLNSVLPLSRIDVDNSKYWYLNKIVCDMQSHACMTNVCLRCPNVSVISDILSELLIKKDLVSYKQWVKLNKDEPWALTEFESTVVTFIECFTSQLIFLKWHHYVWKSQRNFICGLKSSLPLDTVLFHCDFAENYTVVNQDEIQAAFFSPSQFTLHTAMVYYSTDGVPGSKSYCVLSNYNKHDTIAVHSFIKPVFDDLKSFKPEIKNVIFLSDGAASQYKNRKNMSALCKFKKIHDLNVEWHFSASCHGKGAVDGIGGTIKRILRDASIRGESIICPLAAVAYLNKREIKTKVFYVDKIEVQQMAIRLTSLFNVAIPIPGIRSFHAFYPIPAENKVACSMISGSDRTCHPVLLPPTPPDLAELKAWVYVAYVVSPNDGIWHVGQIVQQHHECIGVIRYLPDGDAGSYNAGNNPDFDRIPHNQIKYQFSKHDQISSGDGKITIKSSVIDQLYSLFY